MNIRFYIYPYSMASGSARALAQALECKRIRKDGNYHHQPGHLIINWGSTTAPVWGTQMAIKSMLNKPQYVSNASEKIRTFEILSESMAKYLPDWTRSQQTARGWLNAPNPYGSLKKAVVCRTLTRANSGRGIVIAAAAGDVVPAPLYTRYKPKQSEFRVHVHRRFGVMDVQQKRRKNDADKTKPNSELIRSWDNDWIFAREGVSAPSDVLEAAELAINHLGLDFGAVDIGYHRELGPCIYEVNTAPGIEGQTLTNYANAFRRYLSA